MIKNPDAPVTRFTSVNVVPENNNILEGDFFGFPQLTQAQIDEIPVEDLLPGIVVYNLDYNVYMAYFINEEDDLQNRWMNINTSLTYKSTGLEVGSPFALPAGVSTVIENPASGNSDPGVMYIATDLGDQPRIYMNGAWQDVASGGGGSPTFTDVTVTDTTRTANLIVSDETTLRNLVVTGGVSTFTGEIDVEFLGATTLLVDENATIDGELIVNNDLVVNVNSDLSGYTTMFGGTTCTTLQIGGANVELGPIGFFGGTTGAAPNYLPGFSGVLGAGAGTGGSFTLQGSPLSGVFTLTSGSSPSADAIVVTFTLFNSYLYDAPFGVTIIAANAAAASVTNSVYTYSIPATTDPAQFIIKSSPALPLSADTLYTWNYQIISNTYNIG